MKSARFVFFFAAILFTTVFGAASAWAQVTYTGIAANRSFGSQPIGSASAAQTLSFSISSGTTVGSIAVVTTGIENLDFTDAGGGTCAAQDYTAAATCTVDVMFKPLYAGSRMGAVVFFSKAKSTGTVLGQVLIYGTGTGPQIGYSPAAGISFSRGCCWGLFLSNVRFMAVDAAGNQFIASTDGNYVIEIPAVGGAGAAIEISPVANGKGLNGPSGVAVDGAGNLLIADTGNNRVVVLPPGGGAATVMDPTVDGAGLLSPFAVVVNGAGDLYIADGGNSRVVEVPAGGSAPLAISPVADGKGLSAGFQDVALDAAGDLFIMDFGNKRVVEVPAGGGAPISIAPTVNGLGLNPNGVVVDVAGNLFITDYVNERLVELPAGGAPAIAFDPGLRNPVGLAVDGPGNLYIVDNSNVRILELLRSQVPTLNFPTATAVDSTDTTDGTQTVQIQNLGNAALTLSSLNYPSDFPEASGDADACTAPTSLDSGQVCDLPVEFAPQETGTPGTVAVSVEDANNKVVTTSSATITLTVTGPNTYSKTYTATASSGVATFSSLVALGIPGAYTYTATDAPDGLIKAVATESVVAPHLAFTTSPPGALTTGETPGSVAVSVEDANNNVLTTSGATVTLTVTGPNTYSKVYTATASSGVATFSSLPSLSTVGSYTYTATDAPDGLTQAVATETVVAPHLAFTTPPPGNLEVFSKPGTVAVGVEDASNNVMTASSATVKLIVTGPNSYAKAYTAVASSGVATFSSLPSLSFVGTYTYKATDTTDGLTQAVATDTVWSPPPFGAAGYIEDATTFSTTVAQADNLVVTGWAADLFQGAPVTSVSILIDGTAVGNATLGIARPDVAAVYKGLYLHSGWTFTYAASGLSVGTHTFQAVADDAQGASAELNRQSRTFAVSATSVEGPPFGTVGEAVDATTLSTTVSQADDLLVTGWAADPHDGAPVSQVQVLIDGTAVGNATLGIKRPDVAAKFGNADLNSGWKFTYAASSLSLGSHVVQAVASDSLGNSTTLASRAITVTQ